MIQGRSIINGKKSNSINTTSFFTYDAKNNNQLSQKYYNVTTEEIEYSCEIASQVFSDYAATSLTKRAHFLMQIKIEIEENKDSIIEQYKLESGYPDGRAQGEFLRTLGQIQSFIDLLKEGSYVNAFLDVGIEGVPDLRKMLYPIGPIVVFGASNFPLAFSTAGGDTISALAAGCPVIIKGHPYHAGTSELVAQSIQNAINKSGLPAGIFAHLHGEAITIGQRLVEHLKLKGVGFTGSYKAGKALYDIAQKRKEPIPVFAEMGSVNPIFILPNRLYTDSNLPNQLSDSIKLGTGQFCTNPGLILLLGNETSSFLEELKLETLKGEISCMVHPNISKNYELQLQNMKNQGASVFRASLDSNSPAIGVISGEDAIKKPILLEEVFGPFSLVVLCSTISELMIVTEALPGQLTATVLGNIDELKENRELLNIIQNKVGRLLFEGLPTGVSVSPSMNHGGPFPASTDSRFTSVGTSSIHRWLRPICFQDCPKELLPDALKNENLLGIYRTVNKQLTKSSL
tara:strand:- start:28429 stop:29976 length:1548 start_codon:yes stop_codon:yes gene_type:complete